jgi:hypothetical protein
MATKKTTAKKTTTQKPGEYTVGLEGDEMFVPLKKGKSFHVEGFKVIDYEGLDMLVCDRCGFDTFDLGSAKSHLGEHQRTDDLAELTKDTTEHLAENAQVTEEATDDQG